MLLLSDKPTQSHPHLRSMCVARKNRSKEKADMRAAQLKTCLLERKEQRVGRRVKNTNCKAIKICYKTIGGTILESSPFPQLLKEVL